MRIEYVRDGLVEEFHDGIVLHYKEEILVLNLIIFVPVQSLYKHLY